MREVPCASPLDNDEHQVPDWCPLPTRIFCEIFNRYAHACDHSCKRRCSKLA